MPLNGETLAQIIRLSTHMYSLIKFESQCLIEDVNKLNIFQMKKLYI